MKICGWLKYSKNNGPVLVAIDAYMAESDADIHGVRFTVQDFDDDVLLRVDNKAKAEDIVRRVARGENLDLEDITATCPMRYDDENFDGFDDDEPGDIAEKNGAEIPSAEFMAVPPNVDGHRSNAGELEKKHTVRGVIVGVLVIAVLLAALLAPVWNVTIKGDEKPYELNVSVMYLDDSTPNVRLIGWNIMPDEGHKLSLYVPYWNDVAEEIQQDLLANIDRLLDNNEIQETEKEIGAVTASINGAPAVTMYERNCIRMSGKISEQVVFRKQDGNRTWVDSDSVFNGVKVHIKSCVLSKRYSLLNVLLALTKDEMLPAEEIDHITLFGAGA